MDLQEVISSIKGIDERFTKLILKYIDSYIEMSSNKTLTVNNIINQIKRNVHGIVFKDLDGNVSGCVNTMGNEIVLSDDLEYWVLDNTFLHEFTHQIAKNEYIEGPDLIQPNCGLKVGQDEYAEFTAGFRLTEWEVDGNNYAYNKAIHLLDEWVTEWLANKMSGFKNAEVIIDNNGFFRKKTSHGYDGSNIMNLLELVYGGENIANLITGFDLSEEERKSIIPIKELHKLNEMIDSNAVLNQEEVNIFKNLKPPYMKTPNITGLILYYISESMKQDKLEEKNAYLQKMLDVLTRAYSVSFNYKIENCNSYDELMNIYNELSIIQNSIIWHKNLDIMNSLESYKNFEKLRESFISKLTQLNINNKDFASLYLGPSEMLEKFKLEESMIQKESINNKVTR